MRNLAALALALLVATSASSALALQQPNGAQIPSAPGCNGGKPTGLLAAFSCACTTPGICNIGAPCASMTSCDTGMNGTCESTMWHVFNDNTCIPSESSGLNPVTEASLTPETFLPTCGLTFTVITRGTAIFQNVFGWYNVTGSAPQSSDLHPVIGCTDGAGATETLDVRSDPNYKGGQIGFFLLTPEGHPHTAACASGNCCPSVAGFDAGEGYVYYSEREYNPDGVGANPFIHLLIYNSHIVTRRFYFAWEDTFDTTSADFTDLVVAVDGVECNGGGQTCNTGKPGACALGITQCTMGMLGCTELVPPSPEVCNGVDDDCDGTVDNGATCPDPGDICHDGTCVHPCGGQEFPCLPGLACDTASHLCVDPPCVGVSCAADQVCAGGTCEAPCAGVVCPDGQTCLGNACVNLCKNVTCSAGQACKDGVCFDGCTKCDGLVCASPLSCNMSSGLCTNPSCPNGCPTGEVCNSGACVDGCTGVVCPTGQTCTGGQCVAMGAASADGGLTLASGNDGGATAKSSGNGGGGGDGDTFGDKAKSGCACDSANSDANLGTGALAGLLALSAFVGRRRRAL